MNVEKGSYLAGLFEGDGHISISPDNSYKPRFNITFNAKDLESALLIKSWLNNYGFIRNKVRENAIVYTISNLNGLLFIINLINGKLRSPKYRQFQAMVEYLNNHEGQKIELKAKDESPFESNSWLAGFSDADACFDIRYTDGLKKVRIATRYRIDQRIFDPISGDSYLPLLKSISNYLNTNTIISNKKTGNYLNITATSLKSLKIIIDYFTKYSLLSTKYLNYKDWEKVSKYVLNKEHYQKKAEIKLIKNSMNSLRSNFNLEHHKHLQYI